MSFIVLQSSGRGRESWLLAFIVFWVSCFCNFPVALPHGAWVGLRFVIVVFPDHAHLLFKFF